MAISPPDVITTLLSAFNSKDKTLFIQDIASTFYKLIAQIVTQLAFTQKYLIRKSVF